MKLIDLLVQELPKRGGWPEGMVSVVQSSIDGELYFYSTTYDGTGAHLKSVYCLDLCDEHFNTSSSLPCVTRDQYESALSASQKQTWNGEGVPPVGCECECYVDEGIIHCVVVGYDFDGKAVVMRNVPARKYFSIQANSGRIRPLRTEEERKRDKAAEAIDFYMPEFIADTPNEFYHAKKIYDAIAAGKIPGVKLED